MSNETLKMNKDYWTLIIIFQNKSVNKFNKSVFDYLFMIWKSRTWN